MNITTFVENLSTEKIKAIFAENEISTTNSLVVDSVRKSFESPGHHKISFDLLNEKNESEITISYTCTDMSVADDWSLDADEWEKSSGDFESPAGLIGHVFKRAIEENAGRLRGWLAGANA